MALPTWAVRDLSDLTKGPPKPQVQGELSPQQYLELETHKLAHGKVAWVNWALLEDLGFDVKSGTKAQRTAKILDGLGWVIKDSNVSDGEVTGATKKFYADYYGGDGLGPNLGSARAASVGEIQIKGIGITPMLKYYDRKHTARSSTHESIKDAVWGEIFNNEVPYGGNRLIAIIDRGELDSNGESQMLEIRVDPIRLGHFVKRVYDSDSEDKARSEQSAELLPNALPQPEGFLSNDPGEKLYQGFFEFTKRVAVQFSQAYMKRLFHGAITQSNIEISGRMIDFGTASANPNFGKIEFLNWVSPFGSEDIEIKQNLIRGFVNNLVLSESLMQSLFQAANNHGHQWNKYNFHYQLIDAMTTVFDDTYNFEAKKIALELSGVPAEIANKVFKNNERLAADLFNLTKQENKNSQLTNLQAVNTLSDGNVSATEVLFRNIHQLNALSEKNILAVIMAHPEISLFKSLNMDSTAFAKSIFLFLNESARVAKKQNVDNKAFRTLMRANFEFRNKSMDALFLPELRKTTVNINALYLDGKKDLIGKSIDDLVAQSVRTIHGLKWYEAPIAVRNTGGKMRVEIFNALENQTTEKNYYPKDSQLELKKKFQFGRCEMLFAS